MCSMTRVRLAVLFVVATALLAGTPAFAGSGKLYPTGVEDNASGQIKLSQVKLIGIGSWDIYAGTLTITCNGLTPNTRYFTNVGEGVTTSTGTLKVQGRTSFVVPTVIYGEVYNGAGQLVLFGGVSYK